MLRKPPRLFAESLLAPHRHARQFVVATYNPNGVQKSAKAAFAAATGWCGRKPTLRERRARDRRTGRRRTAQAVLSG